MTEQLSSKHLVKCPYCGAEYLPAEIYIPEDFLPECEDVVKDENSKLVAYHDNGMNLHEEYTCDKCGHRFTIDAVVDFKTAKAELHDFNYDYTTPVYTEDRINLKEK